MMLAWCILTTLIVAGLASQETHRFVHISEDGEAVSQDIIHDKDENTVIVIVGDVSMYKGYIPTVNLHDFNTGITNITKTYRAKDDPHRLTYDQVNLVAGPKIADFCKDYNTYLRQLIPKPEVQKRGQEPMADAQEDLDPCRFLCIWCKVEFDMQSLPVVG